MGTQGGFSEPVHADVAAQEIGDALQTERKEAEEEGREGMSKVRCLLSLCGTDAQLMSCTKITRHVAIAAISRQHCSGPLRVGLLGSGPLPTGACMPHNPELQHFSNFSMLRVTLQSKQDHCCYH